MNEVFNRGPLKLFLSNKLNYIV